MSELPQDHINNVTDVPKHMLVFVISTTNRLRYIMEELFKRMLGLDLEITNDKEAFMAYDGPKLNYSNRQFQDELFFYATPLLFERRIKPQKIKMGVFEEVPHFYISNNNSDIPFDLFAASFFLMSRYEEYFDKPKDLHQRFQAEESLAYQNDFLELPVVDLWVQQLKKVLLTYYPDLPIQKEPYAFIPTYDIDNAYAYRRKGLLRSIGGYINDLRHWNWDNIGLRTNVLLGREKDPYDTYEWLFSIQEYYRLRAIYFFLVGEYGSYDKNISIFDPTYQTLIQFIGDFCEVGIHPSYQSNESTQRLAREVGNLTNVIKKEVRKSRQHYLKLDVPTTYENLIELDIYQDFSMGYSSQVGFRAGTASSFYFYDLSLEVKTRLRIYPFTLMDVTLKNYLQLDIHQALDKSKTLIDTIKGVDGLFLTIFHNSSFCDREGWEGWKEMYEELVKYAVDWKEKS